MIQKHIPSGVGLVFAVDDDVDAFDEIFALDEVIVAAVDEVAVNETVEVSAVDEVAFDEVVDDEVFAVDGSFDAAAEKDK